MDKELVTQAIKINVLSTEQNVSHQLDRFVDKKLLPVIEYRYIRHADLSFDNLLTWQEGLASVLFLVTAPFRKQNNFSARYMVQHLLAASTKCSQPCL